MDEARAFLEHWHLVGLFAVILAEEAGVPLPVPGDLFIAAAGFLAHGRPGAFPGVAAVVTAATVLGASVLYLLARHAGRPLLLRVGARFGYGDARRERLEAWLSRRGALAVVVGRLVPGLRIVMTVVAGALRLRQAVFALGTLLAGLVWATLYFWAGYGLAAGWGWLSDGASRAWPFLAAAAAVLLLVAWHRLRGRRLARERRGPRPPARS
ncbi:MAG TPA: DedA family protein [Anaeromyxobacteraceae bacterium]|nr:DedA family protein [Anaeromyxobacteraceae bacterium]